MSKYIADIIFDLDGTLIDSAPTILRCFSATLSKHDLEPVLPLSEKLVGPPLRETLIKLSGIHDEVVLKLMINDFKNHYDTEEYKSTAVFPGVEEMLHEVHRKGIKLHIATNKRLNPTRLIAEHLGWNDMFASIYASDSTKPPFGSKGDMLSVLINNEKIDVARAVYVGDRADDMKAASNNMLGFIAAMWGYQDGNITSGKESVQLAESPLEISQIITMMKGL